MMPFLSSWFMAPALLGFLGLLPVVVLLYILKLRRTEVTVPSTLLWMKSLQDLTANAPFQRLRSNLLMLLQLLILALLAVALARPFIEAAWATGDTVCVVIDASASMQTREDGGTRLVLVKEEARAMVDEMESGDRMMVVSFGHGTNVACRLTSDKLTLRRAIDGIAATDSAGHIRDALLLANSLVSSEPDLRVVLFSDGRLADMEDTSAFSVPMNYVRVGETRENAGIVSFQERAAPMDETKRQTFLLVYNDNDAPIDTTLSLYMDGDLLGVESVRAGPESTQEVVFAHGDLGEGVLRAVLDLEDALAVDNEAWLTLKPAAAVKTLLVTDPNADSAYYLQRAFALERRVELSTITPEAYSPTDAFELTLFNGSAPSTLPGGTSVYVDTLPPLDGMKTTGTAANLSVLNYAREHPLMRFLNPSTVKVAQATQATLPTAAIPLISSLAGPLVADVSQGDRRVVWIGFDLTQSDWPWHLSFPLFLQNLVSWVPRASVDSSQGFPSGAPLTIAAPPEVGVVTLTRPDGEAVEIEMAAEGSTYYGDTARTGVYRVAYGEMTSAYAVNLLDRGESAVAPAEAVAFGKGELVAVEREETQNRELWPLFVLAALGVLMMEWWIYSRRAWM